MPSGAGSPIKEVAAVILSAAALILTFRSFRTDAASSQTTSSCVVNMAAAEAKPTAGRFRESTSFDPTIQLARLAFSESQEYKGRGRNIFSAEVEQPKLVEPKLVGEEKITPRPTPEPIATAPLSLQFFGFTVKENDPRKVFISDGDALFVATEGDIVDRRYRIAGVGSNSIELEDLIEHHLHTLILHGLADAH
jgi:hypothetical protein